MNHMCCLQTDMSAKACSIDHEATSNGKGSSCLKFSFQGMGSLDQEFMYILQSLLKFSSSTTSGERRNRKYVSKGNPNILSKDSIQTCRFIVFAAQLFASP